MTAVSLGRKKRAIVLAVVALVVGCSKPSTLVGQWRYTIPGFGVPDIPAVLTVHVDGTYQEEWPTLEWSTTGTWEWRDGKYELVVAGRDTAVVFIEPNEEGGFTLRTYLGDALDGLALIPG